jgi:imidazolonepropionase-like amidohydrolase
MIHANGKAPVAIALDSGCRSIEHGFFMGLENLKKVAEKYISWIPTAVTMQAHARHLKSAGQNADMVRKNLDH